MSEMNLFQKINEVKKVVKVLSKDDKTSGKGAYTYVSGSQILRSIKDKMEEIGLLFLIVGTEHEEWTTFNYKNSYGDEKTDFIVRGKLHYEWINADKPEERQRLSMEYYGQQNDISKAYGSGLTYSERYALLKSLGAPTDEDDPDRNDSDKHQNSYTPPATHQNNYTPPATHQNSKPKSATKFSKIKDMISGSSVTLESVSAWIAKRYNQSIKINDLTDEQFAEVTDALSKFIAGTT